MPACTCMPVRIRTRRAQVRGGANGNTVLHPHVEVNLEENEALQAAMVEDWADWEKYE